MILSTIGTATLSSKKNAPHLVKSLLVVRIIDRYSLFDKTEVQRPVDLPFADGSLEAVVKFFQTFVQ